MSTRRIDDRVRDRVLRRIEVYVLRNVGRVRWGLESRFGSDFENTTLGMSFMGAAYASFEVGQKLLIPS